MVGFLHVPLLPELVDAPERQPSMAMALQAAGLDLVIDACRTAADEAGLYVRSTA
jgi:pyrrolidone-carboxylate peptidase